MVDTTHEPRLEDYGLTEPLLAGAREPFVNAHRGLLCVAVVAAMLLTTAAVTMAKTGSLAAGVFLAAVLVAASLIVVVPLTVAVLCLAGAAEERWRARTDPVFLACARYREALAEHQSTTRRVEREERRRDHAFWLRASRASLLDEVRRRYGGDSIEALDREATGADIMVRGSARATLIRCEPGPDPVTVTVGRELAMACIDLGAGDAILVAPGGATPSLQCDLERRPIRLVDAAALSRPTSDRTLGS